MARLKSPTDMIGLRTIAVLLCVLISSCAAPAKLPDTDGAVHSPLSGSNGDLVAIVFSSTDCPIANAMAPDIQRASSETHALGGRFYLIHARRDLTAQAVKKHAKEYALTMPILVDRNHDLVEALGATVTPEALVLRFNDDDRYEILYRGTVNNLYSSVGNRRKEISEHHLRDAVRIAASGGVITVPRRDLFGCYIERTQ
ncbi:MAG: redoxin domain-containing protein [Phycisphaerales bacterium]|nr:redoxin domain-containing protein [Phycisphaerales bacterium]